MPVAGAPWGFFELPSVSTLAPSVCGGLGSLRYEIGSPEATATGSVKGRRLSDLHLSGLGSYFSEMSRPML